jgi:hypothetical protein
MLGELELDTADDFLIAQMLQKQYDKEHDSALHYVSDVIRFYLQKRHHTGNNIDAFSALFRRRITSTGVLKFE